MYTVGAAGLAMAETIVVDDQVQVRESTTDKPKRGVTMTQVEAKFGQPVTKHDAVGAPPITRWDYAGFSVFFEHDRVIDSVITSPSDAATTPASDAATTPASNSPASG
jgi:hypothetical protein